MKNFNFKYSTGSALGTMASSKHYDADSRVSSKSIFSDPIWYMGEYVHFPGVSDSDTTWNFRSIPRFPFGFSLSIAEFAYSLFHRPSEDIDPGLQWLTVRNSMVGLRIFSKFCFSKGLSNFDEVDTQICNHYKNYLTYELKLSVDRIRTLIRDIYKLWNVRFTTSSPMKEIPFDMSFQQLYANYRSEDRISENATPPIPEPIYGSLMSCALDYVLIYSEHIICTSNEIDDLWESINSLSIPENGKAKRFAAKSSQILRLKPFYTTEPWIDKRKKICIVPHVVSSSNSNLLITTPAWRKRYLSGRSDLIKELICLKTACHLVILAYSGIRASEFLSLKAGCAFFDSDSGITKYYLKAMIYKDKGVGSLETWVVIEEVYKAVIILEALTKNTRSNSKDDRLLLHGKTTKIFTVSTNDDIEYVIYSFEAINYQLNRFVEFCNSNLDRDPIPLWPNDEGQYFPWSLCSRQFRRTLARYIARQPFGVIAGQRQYKHADVSMFEGYAGFDPSWNKLLDEEKVLASIDILEELSVDLADGSIAGEFGLSIKAKFEAEFLGRSEDFKPSQIAKWLANNYKDLFVGKFNFCFFDPTKALCRSSSSEGQEPNLNSCDPALCSNSCIAPRHIPLWQAQLNQTENLVNSSKATENQKKVLLSEMTYLKNVIDTVKLGNL